MMGVFLNRYVVGAALAAFLLSGAYFTGHVRGYAKADQRARVADLEAALGAARQDLDAQRVAAEHSRMAAIENGRAAVEAQERIDAYEAELQARGADARCLLGDDDLKRLRQYGHGSDHTAAPGR